MLEILPKVRSMKFGYGAVGSEFVTEKNEGLEKEGYRLILDSAGIRIEYADEAGKFYALSTLDQIKAQCEKLPCVVIEDAPKYSYRGFMLDCARHFFTVADIKKQISVMAALKLNKFHWHLTDDQGWRVEIKKYPLLTEIGSRRRSTRNDDKPVEGYYTQEEIADVIKFCAERRIEVIPEIDMPGHFTAALAAYPQFGCTGEPTRVAERFGVLHEIACGGKEETLEFCKDVLKEIAELFPSEYIHVGGDEALKLRWMECPHCQKKMAEENLRNEEELQGYFLTEIINYLNSLGKTAIVWNDGVVGGNTEGNYCVQFWKENAECLKAAERAAEKGKGVIYSPFHYFYLDYPCGMTPLKKVYNYEMRLSDDAVIGLEAPLWTEYVDNIEKAEKLFYPRIFALADRAWAEEKDYMGFLVRLDRFGAYISEKFPIQVETDANPPFFKGKAAVIKFFLNIPDKTFREGSKIFNESRRKWKKKYGKQR